MEVTITMVMTLDEPDFERAAALVRKTASKVVSELDRDGRLEELTADKRSMFDLDADGVIGRYPVRACVTRRI